MFPLLLVFSVYTANTTDTLTLEQCTQEAIEKYPLNSQAKIFQQVYENKTGNLKTAHYPQISLQATGSYQSDALNISLPIPNFKMDEFPKERIQSYIEVIQTVYDGGMISGAIKMEDKQFEMDKKNLEIELRKVKLQVTQIYFAGLFLKVKHQVLELTLKELEDRIRNLQSAMNAGVALETALNQLKAEKIRVDQKVIETKSEKNSVREIMGIFLRKKISEDAFWKTPESGKPVAVVAQIDSIPLTLKRKQLDAAKMVVASKTKNVIAQINVLKEQMKNLVREKDRVEKLFKDGAATSKQMDDKEYSCSTAY